MGSIYKRGHVYWIKYYRSGQSFRESSKSDRKSDAVRLLHLREGHLAEGRPFSPRALRLRFEDLAADVRNDYASRGLRTTRRVNELLAHLSRTFAGWQASEITTDAIRAYIASRQQEGAANGTINRETAALGRGFTLALQAGKLWHKSHIPKLRESNPRQGFFEPAVFEAVRAALPDHLYGVATFAYYVGWRLGEIVALRWGQVDLTRGEVRLEPGTTKNGEGRTIFLEGELRDVLKVMSERRVAGCDYVFHRQGRKLHDFRKAWAAACSAAGVVPKVQPTNQRAATASKQPALDRPGLLFHDLRRTAVRNMVRAGVPERVAMQISGHKTRSVFDRYHIVSDGDLRDAAWRVAAWNGGVHAAAASDGHSLGTTEQPATAVDDAKML